MHKIVGKENSYCRSGILPLHFPFYKNMYCLLSCYNDSYWLPTETAAEFIYSWKPSLVYYMQHRLQGIPVNSYANNLPHPLLILSIQIYCQKI